MVRTLEGKETHRKLMEKSAEFLQQQGYEVVFQAKLNNGRIDVFGIKNREKIGIECQVVPSWKMLAEKTKKYKPYLNKFIVAIPSYVKPRLQPENIEIIKFDVPRALSTANEINLRVSGVERELWAEVKKKATMEDKTVGQVLNEILKAYFAASNK